MSGIARRTALVRATDSSTIRPPSERLFFDLVLLPPPIHAPMSRSSAPNIPMHSSFRTHPYVSPSRGPSWRIVPMLVLAACSIGCGTTRMTNSARTATEQLLISDVLDRAVDDIDCTPLSGKSVYFDFGSAQTAGDKRYLADTVRQKLLASGCVLKDKKTDADLVVGLRIGAIGTDSNRVMFGVPSVNVPPALMALSATPVPIPTIPELPLAKKQAQRGVAKIGLFAYDQKTGGAYWQSGALPIDSTAKEFWLLGAGPWQWGTIYDQPKFAGGNMPLSGLFRRLRRPTVEDEPINVSSTALFNQPTPEVLDVDVEPGKIQLAGHAEPIADEKTAIPPKKGPAAAEGDSDENKQSSAPDSTAPTGG
jgi:hypothetical protein